MKATYATRKPGGGYRRTPFRQDRDLPPYLYRVRKRQRSGSVTLAIEVRIGDRATSRSIHKYGYDGAVRECLRLRRKILDVLRPAR